MIKLTSANHGNPRYIYVHPGFIAVMREYPPVDAAPNSKRHGYTTLRMNAPKEERRIDVLETPEEIQRLIEQEIRRHSTLQTHGMVDAQREIAAHQPNQSPFCGGGWDV